MHDPKVYPEPDRFLPDRFIQDGKLDPSVRDPRDFVFGFGRRSVAMHTLYFAIPGDLQLALAESVLGGTLPKPGCSQTWR